MFITLSRSFLTSSLSGASFTARLVRKPASPRARRAWSESVPCLKAKSARLQPRCAVTRAFAGSTCIAVRRPSTVPSLILFSSHSETLTFENGEIVRLLPRETHHFRNRCNGVNLEDGPENFAAIFSQDALLCSGL